MNLAGIVVFCCAFARIVAQRTSLMILLYLSFFYRKELRYSLYINLIVDRKTWASAIILAG